jgi:hypothetical protein
MHHAAGIAGPKCCHHARFFHPRGDLSNEETMVFGACAEEFPMLIPRLMLSRTITHRSIRMSVQGLAIAASLILSSCRPVTTEPQPAQDMPPSPALAAVTPGVVLVPQGKYLFVEWTLEIPYRAAISVCDFGAGVAPTPAYEEMGARIVVYPPGDAPEGTIGFVGMREYILDWGGETVSPIPSIPFIFDDHAQFVRVETDGSAIVELFGTLYQVDVGKDLTILREDVVYDCKTVVYYKFINHGWLGPDQITVY